MRDYLVFAIVFGSLPFVLKRPVIGVLMFTWLSLMNPHRLTYGAAYDFPFAALVAATTLLGLLVTSEPRQFRFTPVIAILLIFVGWFTLTSFFALEPELVWKEWNRVSKTMFMTLVAIITLNSKQDIKAFTYVVGLSLGFYGAKGGVFTILSGGSNHVFGPEGSYIADNNDLALALVTTLPIIWYLRLTSDNKWLRMAFSGLAILVLISVVGSYSRGALLAGAVMLSFLWLKSRGKATTGLALVLVVSLVFMVMPEQWFERMRSIDDYHADASALGRLNAWQFAMNIAETNLLGGGFNVFTPRMFTQYAPEPLNHHAAHSIYFQVLGEHGFIGLSLFLSLMLFTWLTARRIRKLTQDRAEMKWAFDLATMCQVSVIGYAVGGAFLTLAYFDLYYDLIALIVVLERWVCMQAREIPPSKTAASIPQPQGIPL